LIILYDLVSFFMDTNQQKEDKMNKREKMYQMIQKHGDNLKAIFNINEDSVKLCKKLFRLENKAHRLATDYCNGDFQGNIKNESKKIVDKAKKILKTNEIFFNRDARGYALKIKDDFIRVNNLSIYRDWGGYGIIAPDFRE
jgi:Mg2+ and Co2+ transporter CorA